MFTFNLQDKTGILIFKLHNFRMCEDFSYSVYGARRKRLNSYAFFDVGTKELKIIHYDEIKARIYNDLLGVYTVQPGEKILGLRGSSCFYIDHNGNKIGYAGDAFFFSKFRDFDCTIEQKEINKVCSDTDEILPEESDFRIENNRIIHKNGSLFECNFLLKEKFLNVILCYKYIETNNSNKTQLFGICDSRGILLSEIKYDEIVTDSKFIIRNQYIRVKHNNKFGLISFDGKEILPTVYDDINDCNGNIAIVNLHKQLIRIEDLSVIYESEDGISNIFDGWMKVSSRQYPYSSLGLLDTSGRFYEFYDKNRYWGKKQLYQDIGISFHDNLLPVFSPHRGYGYVDIESNEIIECKYCEISDFENGRARVRLDCEYGFINTEGCMLVKKNGKEIAIPKTYDWAYDFDDKNEFFVVQKGNLYGAIDEYMNVIIPCSLRSKEDVELTFSRIRLKCQSLCEKEYKERYNDLLQPIRYEENSLYGYKSGNGKMIFPPVLRVSEFVEGMAIINISGRKGYINEKLELVIEPKYDYALNFSEGLALVHEIGEGSMFINKLGEIVFRCNHHLEKIQSFSNGIARCEYNFCTPGKDNEDYEISKYSLGYII